MEELILELVMWLIRLAGLAIIALLIPYIRTKTTESQYNKILNYVSVGVSAAQQMYKVFGAGFDRKQYVVDWLRSQKLNITEEQLDALIEAAVFELNQIMKEAQGDTEIPTSS